MVIDKASHRANNFDFIRLLAALQVAFIHGTGDLKIFENGPLSRALGFFPGVPIFFVVSGFLISQSWERAPSWRQYAWNRGLRIYPALWVCLLISIAIFLISGVRPDSAFRFLAWFIAQITIFQYYNPDFLRGFGLGALNGSLWTIPVELQFYLALPVLAVLARRNGVRWLVVATISMLVMLAARLYLAAPVTTLQKLLHYSVVAYLFYFLVGVLIRQLFERRPTILAGKGLIWTGVYGAWIAVEWSLGLSGRTGNQLNVASIVLLGLLCVSLAFSMPKLSSGLLKGNDISYGVYIYHAPIINLLLFRNVGGLSGLVIFLAATLTCAILSWRFIERPALRLKTYSSRALV